MENQKFLDAIANALSQVSAPLVVHQQIGQILKQAQEQLDKEKEQEACQPSQSQ